METAQYTGIPHPNQIYKNTIITKRMGIISKDGLKFSQEQMCFRKHILFNMINQFKEVFLIVISFPH